MKQLIIATLLVSKLSSFAQSYTTTLLVDQSPKQVYNAITNARAWWSQEITPTDSGFLYHFKDVHICKIKILESIPGKRVVWYVVDNRFNFIKDTTEWKGTKMIFDITKKNNKTELRFTHEGLVPEYECYEICKQGWANYIDGSLKDLITTGKGKPNPKEGGFNQQLLDNWKKQ